MNTYGIIITNAPDVYDYRTACEIGIIGPNDDWTLVTAKDGNTFHLPPNTEFRHVHVGETESLERTKYLTEYQQGRYQSGGYYAVCLGYHANGDDHAASGLAVVDIYLDRFGEEILD